MSGRCNSSLNQALRSKIIRAALVTISSSAVSRLLRRGAKFVAEVCSLRRIFDRCNGCSYPGVFSSVRIAPFHSFFFVTSAALSSNRFSYDS